ncbi:hypothetical protein ACHAC9_22370 [Massilia sp. CMS3.1]|uniref:hypothetical protein n=1 Tax=Massilia sp. CMS3.1 TaxID=3373083 RepID=UPI003EE60B7D
MSRVIIRDVATGAVTFDSTVEHVLAVHWDGIIYGGNVGTGAGVTYSFPELAGKRVQAFMYSPYNNGEVDGWSVLSCRVSYPNGIPTVAVFGDESRPGIPVCDGMLSVIKTGGNL